MSAARLLRAASAIALVQFVAHTTLFLRATPRHGAAEVAIVQAMRSGHFDFGGASRSYWDFYFGYGLMAAFVVLMLAVVLWQLGSALAHGRAGARSLVRSLVWVLLAYVVGHALLAARYFFVTPIIPDALVALCLTTALVQLRGEARGGSEA